MTNVSQGDIAATCEVLGPSAWRKVNCFVGWSRGETGRSLKKARRGEQVTRKKLCGIGASSGRKGRVAVGGALTLGAGRALFQWILSQMPRHCSCIAGEKSCPCLSTGQETVKNSNIWTSQIYGSGSSEAARNTV